MTPEDGGGDADTSESRAQWAQQWLSSEAGLRAALL